MPNAFREAMKPLAPYTKRRTWKERGARGTISQESYEVSRGKKASWKPK